MVFSTTNLFKSIVCPKLRELGECKLTNCIYGHSTNSGQVSPTSATPPITNGTKPAEQATEPPLKRRKVTYNSLEEKTPSRADLIRSQLAAQKRKPPAASPPNGARVSQSEGVGVSLAQPQTLHKPVTPPPTSQQVTSISGARDTASGSANKNGHDTAAAPAVVKPEKTESLNPRLVASDPVGHAKRQLFLKYLHAELVRLNLLVLEAATLDSKEKCRLTPQQLITMALDLEERFVRESGAVYSNVIKQRIAAYKKMSLEAWVAELKITVVKEESPPPKPPPKAIETGLLLEQEPLILPQLVADQRPLAAHGYIITPPSNAQIQEAKAAVAASHNWEECDRCSARFQVFPERNAEGLLTGNGPCKYHPRRKAYPQRTKADKDKNMVSQGPYYPCCDEGVGTPGCTSQAEHVFNTKSPARLASVLPFISTPENPAPKKSPQGREVQAVTFDCEMGYTANGLELIRLTAVAWPTNEQLVDVLVRPLGAIIDLNSKFSGVFPESFTNAIPYENWAIYTPPPPSQNESHRLPIVGSPAKARELLCSFLTPRTPLIGHAIDNDLNTVRLCHPTIIDTVILFPHPRGLPMRFGLKMLTQKYLNRQIQMGGDLGHDSKEDAIATGDLVRVKVAQKWKDMRITGWKIVNGKQLLPPPPPKRMPFEINENTAKAMAERIAFGTPVSKKRRRKVSTDGADDGSETDEEFYTPSEGLKTS
ncbi:Putative ribonuclease H-like superfamily, exonuclease, RNase T/DNA polymerase III [Septoria linicola]|uniref:Ribonuclease H-like superfamily, exonuclease, RNase T/DNA polymerase III n=1 Tax=Septoria linicola TaxID=215465 RepID=A0A9Q9ECM6_9PEZI|nr:putative ribonuclease H-like superfamily, exonuclease, RNase T/DNA polymerase III [Septoria linicola]USW46861.1 Putative ribonuclease H-like superfamily, exonuclease, RNase T/DNA polymerase III [Septoria linicola]